jgi:hypothetical protein
MPTTEKPIELRFKQPPAREVRVTVTRQQDCWQSQSVTIQFERCWPRRRGTGRDVRRGGGEQGAPGPGVQRYLDYRR